MKPRTSGGETLSTVFTRSRGRPLAVQRIASLVFASACSQQPIPADPAHPAPPSNRSTSVETHSRSAETWTNAPLDYNYFRWAWASTGRDGIRKTLPLARHGGVWQAIPGGVVDSQRAYAAEHGLLAALAAAESCGDVELLDEVSAIYVAVEQALIPLPSQRPSGSGKNPTRLGKASARTTDWGDQRGRECHLCNAQFFFPAARLLRLVADRAPHDRSDVQIRFASIYGPLLAREHLMRLVYGPEDPASTETASSSRLSRWKKIAGSGHERAPRFRDVDAWLLASLAEVLAAFQLDPSLSPLSSVEQTQLDVAYTTGLLALEAQFELDSEGRIHIFEGDFDNHPSHAHSGWTSKELPEPSVEHRSLPSTWDVSHAHRIPVVLRSLLDVRGLLGTSFPSDQLVSDIADHFAETVHYELDGRPLFHNFLNGTDGWFRVGRRGPATGYAPSSYCDARSRARMCLTPGAVQGWGLLAFASLSLREVVRDVVLVAVGSDPEQVAFRDRYYFYADQSFDAEADPPPLLLLYVLGSIADQLPGCHKTGT